MRLLHAQLERFGLFLQVLVASGGIRRCCEPIVAFSAGGVPEERAFCLGFQVGKSVGFDLVQHAVHQVRGFDADGELVQHFVECEFGVLDVANGEWVLGFFSPTFFVHFDGLFGQTVSSQTEISARHPDLVIDQHNCTSGVGFVVVQLKIEEIDQVVWFCHEIEVGHLSIESNEDMILVLLAEPSQHIVLVLGADFEKFVIVLSVIICI